LSKGIFRLGEFGVKFVVFWSSDFGVNVGFWVISGVWVQKSAHKRAGFRTICASCREKLDKNEQKLNKMKQKYAPFEQKCAEMSRF